MKVLAITLTLAGIAATAPLDAQVIARNPASERIESRTNVNGSWYPAGRDGSGNTVYERRTRDRNGNIVIQRARRDVNGNMIIVSTRTVRNGDDRGRRNCDYTRSTNSIGDIIFGRTNNTVCDDEYSREDGGWYQVGRGRDNNSIYMRRTRDANGNLVIQRARRNSNGTFTILSSRIANDSDKEWKKAQKAQRKAVKRAEKQERKEMKRDHDGDNRYLTSRRDDDRSGKDKDHKNKH